MRGTTDYWINDREGRPFFVVNTAANPGLIAVDVPPRRGAEIIAPGTREVLAECGLDLPQALQGPLLALVNRLRAAGSMA